jgi:CheY-like chemotaxis protein
MGDHLVFEVRDTGIGIAPQQREVIFASFRQLDIGLARSYEGLGLGLALARKLANLMDGTISVESALGEGSRFTLRLPQRAPVEHSAEVAAPIEARMPAILAVEDNPVGLTVLRRALERYALVTCADSGQAALEAAAARRYDLVLMDLHMPEMDGLETTEALRRIAGYHNVPILALTANASDEVRERCRKAGMQAFLAKPVEAATLWSAVSKFL